MRSQHLFAKSVTMKCGVTRKIRFKSHEAAIRRAGEILKEGAKGTDSFRAYKCIYCGGWHLTSK